MPNTFITLQEIARQALPRLIENLVMPNLCYRDFSDTFSSQLGDTIQVRKPVVLTASEFDPGTGTSAQDVKENAELAEVVDRIDRSMAAFEKEVKDGLRKLMEVAQLVNLAQVRIKQKA